MSTIDTEMYTEEQPPTEEKRRLTKQEIEDIVSTIIPREWRGLYPQHEDHLTTGLLPDSDHESDDEEMSNKKQRARLLMDSHLQMIKNNRKNIRKQLQDIVIYPSCIPELKQLVQTHFHISRIQPGEMVGMTAASSIGEQFTQSSLNR